MKTKNFMVLGGILMLAVLSEQYVFADSSAVSNGAPNMKRTQVAHQKDLVSSRLESMTRHLGLSPVQQAAIKPILLDEAANLKVLGANATQTVAVKKTKLQELRDATDSKIRPILTADQLNRHEELLKAISERRKYREDMGSSISPAK
jgi:hypothetical protein